MARRTKMGIKCGCKCDVGGLCVTLTSPCTSTDKDSVTITVKDHATGTVVATDATDSAGHVCFVGLPPGSYDVTATKTDCTETTWEGVAPGDNLTGVVDCYPVSARQFRIFGCNSLPLDGAVITVTGPGPTTTILTTDGSGHAIYSPSATGLHTYTVTHPSGRFNPSSGSWTQASSCTSGFNTSVLGASTGHRCCVSGTPYPVKTTLNITDAGGTDSFTFAPFSCGATVCLPRTMGDVSVTGTPQTLSCSPSGSAQFPPSDIATRTSSITYTIAVGNPPTLIQSERAYRQGGRDDFPYHGDHDTDGLCTPTDTFRSWRIQTSCPMLAVQNFSPTGVVVNSLYPFAATFTFAPGLGYGPRATAGSPGPFSTTVVISE